MALLQHAQHARVASTLLKHCCIHCHQSSCSDDHRRLLHKCNDIYCTLFAANPMRMHTGLDERSTTRPHSTW
jgi:hypothetical protein